jgi:hypothetical protein
MNKSGFQEGNFLMNSTMDQVLIEELTSILRKEVEEYGELLAVLVEQQEKIMIRDSTALLEINRKMEVQMEINEGLLIERHRLIALMAGEPGGGSEPTLSQLIDSFPDAVQPMFQSFAEEINNLISRARRKMKQNQVLLSRLSEVADELVKAISPDDRVLTTYNRQGGLDVSLKRGKRLLKITA